MKNKVLKDAIRTRTKIHRMKCFVFPLQVIAKCSNAWTRWITVGGPQWRVKLDHVLKCTIWSHHVVCFLADCHRIPLRYSSCTLHSFRVFVWSVSRICGISLCARYSKYYCRNIRHGSFYRSSTVGECSVPVAYTVESTYSDNIFNTISVTTMKSCCTVNFCMSSMTNNSLRQCPHVALLGVRTEK